MNNYIIKSLEDYVSHMEKYKGTHLFRGQANANWSITPSLFRNTVEDEADIILNIIDDSSNNIVTQIFNLQHLGYPTRLVDLTVSLYSALFFALSLDDEKDNNGIVYVFKPTEFIEYNNIQLNELCNLLTKKNLTTNCPNELIDFAIANHIIKYQMPYSYSNIRAMLQGGTSIIIGLGYDGHDLYRKKDIDLESLIVEKIIIPKEIKTELLKKINELGYCSNVMYANWANLQTSEDFTITEIESNVSNCYGFYKIIIKYQLNTPYPNTDILVEQIKAIYKTLFEKYGPDSRIWLYICYDKNDIDKGNWICRTKWSNNTSQQIIWEKDYLSRRLTNINEEISYEEAFARFVPLIRDADTLYQQICDVVKGDSDLQDIISKYHFFATQTMLRANNIPYVSVDKEPVFQLALRYINEIEQFYSSIKFFLDRKENIQFIKYWCDLSYKKCTESKNHLKV